MQAQIIVRPDRYTKTQINPPRGVGVGFHSRIKNDGDARQT